MPLHLQVKLLRVLQEHIYEHFGDHRLVGTNARIVAGTSTNLRKEVACGLFRGDLYYRLCVFPLDLPPLRQRRGDIGSIARGALS